MEGGEHGLFQCSVSAFIWSWLRENMINCTIRTLRFLNTTTRRSWCLPFSTHRKRHRPIATTGHSVIPNNSASIKKYIHRLVTQRDAWLYLTGLCVSGLNTAIAFALRPTFIE